MLLLLREKLEMHFNYVYEPMLRITQEPNKCTCTQSEGAKKMKEREKEQVMRSNERGLHDYYV